MLLWDHGTTAILAGCKPCLLRRGNPRAPQRFLNNVTLSVQIPLCTKIKARLLPCLTLSYPAISGQPGGQPIKMSLGSVVDPAAALLLVAAKKVDQSDVFSGDGLAKIGRDLK